MYQPNGHWVVTKPVSGRLMYGDSGDGLFMRGWDGSYALLGVLHSFADIEVRYSFWERTDTQSPHYGWLRPYLGLPAVACGSVPTPAPGLPLPVVTPNKPPVAAFSYARQVGAGNLVRLDGSSSRDPDGTVNRWVWTSNGATLATGKAATISFGAVSSVGVTLTVTDSQGLTSAVSRVLSLANRAPTIASVSPASDAVVGSNTPTLSAQGRDPDGDTLSYQFRLTGPSVDVSSGWVGGVWTVPAHRLDPGTAYTWTVTVRDPSGLTASRSAFVRIAVLPTAAEAVATSTGTGYWQVATDGGVFAYGSAGFFGSLPGIGIRVSNIIGMARTPTDQGYWLVGRDGGVFAFGDARFYGSLPSLGIRVDNIVGMAPVQNGAGYWLVGSDGGVFAFGSAGFYGSMGGRPLNAPVEAISATATSAGYWLVARDGGVFAFGDAPFHGSMGGQPLNAPVIDIDTAPDGAGYWLAAEDGGVFAFGSARFHGSLAGQSLNGRVTSLAPTPSGGGYWLNACDGGIFAFGDAVFRGSNPTYGCRGT
jgi:hypothetical protein